jgi:hypothetical protein
MEKHSDSNYCPYHRVLGHPIEDCWVFKDWVEKGYTEGIIELPPNVLQSPAPHEAKEQEESVRFRVCTISHDMVDEDSDDEIVFNLKSIKTHLPESGTQKEEKPKRVGSDQNPLKKFKKRNLKEVHRSNHVLNVKTKDEAMSLAITTVPDKYFKDLTPREVNHIQILKTFVVPAKFIYVKGKPIVQKTIIFYKSDSTQSREDSSVDSWERWMMEQEDSGDEKNNGAIIHFFEKKIYELAQRIGGLRDMSKAEVKTFVRLWDNPRKMIMGPNGKIKNTRGLGYESDDDSRFIKN